MARRHASAIKRNRQNLKRRARNKAILSQVRSQIRKAREAIARNDPAATGAELLQATRQLTKAVSKGVLHRNAAARRISRLSKQAAALKS